MKVKPEQTDITSDEMYFKHLSVNNEELEYISKALENMVAITSKIAEDTNNFGSDVRFEIKDMSDKYLKLKSKIDLI